jgi:hypothetical protein
VRESCRKSTVKKIGARVNCALGVEEKTPAGSQRYERRALPGNVDGHLEVDGYTEFIVRERVDADDFGDVFAGQGIVDVGEGKGDEDAHAGIVGGAASGKVDAFFRDVDAGGEILEMFVGRAGRADADGASHFGAAAGALDGVFGFGDGWHKLETLVQKARRSL